MKTINALYVNEATYPFNPDVLSSGIGNYFIPGKVKGSFSGTNLGMLGQNVKEGYKVTIRPATKAELKQIINWYK